MKAVFRHVSHWRIPVVAAVAGLGVLALPATASAQPSNDNFSNATTISSLPFSDVVDNTTATTEPGEPNECSESIQHTVWYSITPASSGAVSVDMSGSSFSDTIFAVYQQTGSGFTGLSEIFCAAFSDHFQASANTTYYIQAGNCCTSGGSLHLNVQEALAPANDNFANATSISPAALPFTDTVDAAGATTEAGEPNPSCAQIPIPNSWWYSFTPTSTESFTATPGGFGAAVAAYTGSALSNLSQIGCASGAGSNLLTFRATAGTTYYLQMSDFFQGTDGPVTFTFDHAQQPIAGFIAEPSDPSIFDTVQFFDNSFDPAQAGIQTEAWDFGDGTTGTGSSPTHQYAADGDYTARLTVTTFDGRTASAQQVIHVSTHDVAITKFSVPTSASAGQTRSITVGASDKRYPETVQVQLLKSNTQGGFDLVGTLTQSIPVTTGKGTTPFAFSYTFTPGDAAVGKVTFEAIATIQGARDAFPADNTAFALTTVH
jgi:PKD domain